MHSPALPFASRSQSLASTRLGCLLIGGSHHRCHLIPAAARIAQGSEIDVDILVTSPTEAAAARDLLDALGGHAARVRSLHPPAFFDHLPGIGSSPAARKTAILLANRAMLARYDALLVVERTSTLLKRLPGRKPFMIHIPHGAGDRAKGFEPRIRHFDHVIVAGAKDKRRMREAGVVSGRNCHVSGYLKPSAVRALSPNRPILFDNGKPTVLYNPHFDRDLSSWEAFGHALIASFAAQDRYNLIVAPHCRLFQRGGAGADALNALAIPGRIHIDTGSERCNDMTYTRAADIYLGDVSSQVYEFLSEGPKPCVFLGHNAQDWRDSPDYAHWRFGEVCSDPRLTFETIARAEATHAFYQDAQVSGVADALGGPGPDPVAIAAELVRNLVQANKKRLQERKMGWRIASSAPDHRFIGEMP